MNVSRVLACGLALCLWAGRAGGTTHNVRDYPSPAAALAAARDGDRVYFPSPGPYPAPPGGWRIARSLEIFGDGPGNETVAGASSIVPDSAGNAFVLDSTVALSNLHIHDLLVVRRGNAPGNRAAIRLRMPDAGTHTLSGLHLERVAFVNLAHDAIALDGGARNAVLLVSLVDCEVNTCGGSGVVLRHTTTTYLLGGYYHDCRGFGLYAEASGGLRLLGTAFEHNQLAGISNDYDAQLRLKLCHGFTVLGCHFEEFSDSARPARTAITVERCLGGQVSSTLFVKNGAGVPGSRGVFILGGSRDIDVGTNSWTLVDTLVSVRGTDENPDCDVREQEPLRTDAGAAGIVSKPERAGTLTRTNLQGDLAPVELATPGGAGLCRVSVYVTTVTSGAGSLTVRLGWNDDAPRTKDVISGFDLARADGQADATCTLALAHGSRLTCRTVTGGSGARYALRVLVEPL